MRWAALLPLAIWLYLVAGHGRFWLTDVRLPVASPLARWPPVVAVVPARDEATLLCSTLPTLLTQDYPGRGAVVLVDDRSADGTGEVARHLAVDGGLPLVVVEGIDTPPGWAGKLWAVEQGVRAALGAHAATGGTPAPAPAGEGAFPFPSPEYLLFTDADIAHPSDSLRRLVAWAERSRSDQVSLMARLRTAGGWERLIIPAFVYFFAELYPFRRVNHPGRRTAAAAGGCVLVRTSALLRAGGVAAVRGAVIDDVSLAGALKRTGSRLWLGLADDVVSTRPYPRLADLWDMVARSAFTQLRYSTPLLAATVVALAVTFLGPLAALAGGAVTADPLAAGAGTAATVIMVATYLPMIRYYRLPAWRCCTLPAVACLYGAMTVGSALRHWRGRASWKGRSL